MKFAMMDPADWDGELIAHSSAQRTRLCKGEVVRIRRHAAAHKAGLPQNELPVVLITQANRLAQGTDRGTARLLLDLHQSFVAGSSVKPADGHPALVRDSMRRPGRGKTIGRSDEGRPLRNPVTVLAIADRGQPRLKPLLHDSGICRCQRVLGRQIPMRKTDGRNTTQVASSIADELYNVLQSPTTLAQLSSGAISRGNDFILPNRVARFYQEALRYIQGDGTCSAPPVAWSRAEAPVAPFPADGA